MTTVGTGITVVATDGHASSDRAVIAAAELAMVAAGKPELHIVTVVAAVAPSAILSLASGPLPDFIADGRRTVDRACDAAALHFSGFIEGHVARGEPWREIVAIATTLAADLVVVGTVGRVGVKRVLLGSVAEEVVRHAGCSVLVVRAKTTAESPLAEEG